MTIALGKTCAENWISASYQIQQSRAIREVHKRHTLRIHWISMNWWGMIIELWDIIMAKKQAGVTKPEMWAKALQTSALTQFKIAVHIYHG